MLWLLFVLLLIVWLGGYFVFNLGVLIHVLLVVAIVMLLYNLLVGRRPVP